MDHRLHVRAEVMGLLIHSLSEFAPLILGMIERCAPKSVLEVGSEFGGFSTQMFEKCAAQGTNLVTIEPFPAPEVTKIAETSESFHLFIGKSIPYFLQEGCQSDFVVIDGDHNWFTVFSELTLIDTAWKRDRRSGVIVMHDVAWPWARRDMYYDPKSLPPEAVRPHSFSLGVTLDSAQLIEGGFRSEGHYAIGLKEGGPCNGVLTAIEDFLGEHPEYTFRKIDAVFGLGVLTLKGTREDAIVEELMAPYQVPLLATLERNRLENYLKVIELQDLLTANAKKTA